MCLSVATRRQDLAVALGSMVCELEKVAGGALSRSQGWVTTLPQLCVEPQADRRLKPRAWLWAPRVHLPTKNTHGARPFQSSEVVWFCCEVFRWLKLGTAPAALAQDPHPTPLASVTLLTSTQNLAVCLGFPAAVSSPCFPNLALPTPTLTATLILQLPCRLSSSYQLASTSPRVSTVAGQMSCTRDSLWLNGI